MQKGPEYFVEAAAKVLQKNKKVRFVMAGGGDMEAAMIRLAAKEEYSRQIPFYRISARKGCISDVSRFRCLCDAFGVRAVRYIAA